MRRSTPVLLALTFLTSSTTLVLAGPYPRNAAHDYNGSGFLMPRQCESYCGYGDAYCCTAGQVCFTNAANIASCGAQTARVGGDGSWNYYTTTIVDSVAVPTTRVVTMSSWVGQPVAASSPYIAQSTAICFAPLISCGSICCASNQYCYTSGQCKPKGDGVGPQPTTFIPPDRGTTVVVTTVPVTTTQGFVAPVETTGSSEPITSVPQKGGLSGGAIAGIVIGVIAGVIILLLILACCCLSAGIKGIWGLVSGKKDDRRGSRTEVIETRRHSTRYGGSNVSRRESHGGWYGGAAAGGRGSGRGSRVNEKHSSHKKEAAGLAVGAAALWAGMKFWNKKKEAQKRRTGTYYSYTESYTGTTDSSTSSGGRTRQSRRSRR